MVKVRCVARALMARGIKDGPRRSVDGSAGQRI
jgi:hypothetical protein